MEFINERRIDCLTDVVELIPEDLPKKFTVKDFAKITALGPNDASVALLLMYRLGVIDRQKVVRGYEYERNSTD